MFRILFRAYEEPFKATPCNPSKVIGPKLEAPSNSRRSTSERPRSMGMPWAYLSKGPADTVRNSALLDDIYRKAPCFSA